MLTSRNPHPNNADITVADKIALSLRPHNPTQRKAPEPLDLPDLGSLSVDTSTTYALCRVDASGAVSARSVVGALGWQPRDPISYAVQSGVLIAHRNPEGLYQVPATSSLMIPAAARRASRITVGQQILLAGLPAHAMLVIYPEAMVVQMLRLFHDNLDRANT
ncbi:hypothetical protein ABZ863_11100 [Saccharomonospora sp. NPDC046836]|uniref:hypothetical protein n=1 Tax=Saccharomonospora sp. NPDC046836 TaxID=3156921 RepID=UPI0033EEF10C